MNIHPTALVDQRAQLHDSVEVGPYSIIEADVVIGPGCKIESSVRIFQGTQLGENNRVYHGAVLGCEPQDLGFTIEKSRPLIVGNNNHFKEGVNISRGVKTDGGTQVGDNNYFMCGFHAGHDCHLGNHNVFGPNSTIAGHVELGDRIFISGLVAIHQFCFIGDYAMIAGCTKVVKDIPPYVTCDGNPARIIGLNSIGLRRAGISAENRAAIKQTYKTIYHDNLNISQALAALKERAPTTETEAIIRFFEQSDRGVTTHR
ncbi:acyl-ACP--UDP-N-acetylglucosamine O-acyltransferase [Sedimenticola selenatireducens]|uniref:Acyl-ACP--UDP-N-acetylglucosamine O-acyltransferase n=1 Tax=Sedimenticola selenatireducens TaxID=191960 RepID=A0A557SGW6_9GAMM|nr:acyl-ACP--UDP-N-acetylglucosamine O-acyltransferase [Sedimenticola selenatireducens]TVO76602.1 acyl-ACP--UDP-N-acetylglucosamine O-acyltransferase [Sedimenticola selenatireducens]TVT64046.1 MAG: acyl-ACP--UDP-N-acetylglucosamine O-acyltransferase [Sedimenticola selenatireducens]